MKIQKIYSAILTIIMLICFTSISSSQGIFEALADGMLKSQNYSRPFVSQIHSTISKVEIGYNKSYDEYNLQEESKRFDRPVVEVHLGYEAPVFATNWGGTADKPKWGFAMTLPLSVHILEDMFEPVTAAVINTDYRFGSPKLLAIRYFEGDGFFKNISMTWIPMFHECTHLGDEIIIYRMDADFPVTRINVSYEYTEFQLTINDPDGTFDNNHSVRLGLVYRLSSRGYGWFDIEADALADKDYTIPESEQRAEYYAQYQYQRTEGFLASKRAQNVFSIEARHRVRYGYPIYMKEGDDWEVKEINETMMWTMNAYLGYRFYPKSGGNSLGLFLHFYKGLNPYGQLRNYPSYGFLGLSLTYEP